MARFYIATTLSNAAAHNRVRDLLTHRGHQITYDWTATYDPDVVETTAEKVEIAQLEIGGVRDADFVVVLLPGGKGTHVEFGAALALGKPVFLLCRQGELAGAMGWDEGGPASVFYHHPGIAWRGEYYGYEGSAADEIHTVWLRDHA